jgi:hypothetical protein
MRRLAVVLVVAALLAGCEVTETRGAGPPNRPRTTNAPERAEPDASAKVSCEHFRNVMGDVGAGILNDAELREKVKEIERSASVSEQPGLPEAGRAMLREITTGTGEGFVVAAKMFDQSCDEAGL